MDVGILVLRLAVGLTVAAHGIQKLTTFLGGHGIAGTSQFVESFGFRPGRFWAYMLGCTELTGGILLATGFLTPVAAAMIVGVMTAAAVVVHRPQGFFVANGGFEYPFILGVAASAIALVGPGDYSFDALLDQTVTETGPVVAAIALGVLAGLMVSATRKLQGRFDFVAPTRRQADQFTSSGGDDQMTTLAPRNGSSVDVRRPMNDFTRLADEIDTLLERAFESVGRAEPFSPVARIKETDDAYVIEVKLPGIKRKEASVEVRGHRVVVSGEHKERKGILRTKERVTSRFHYEAVLPANIDASRVTADYDDGVLTVHAPKAESVLSTERKVEIH